MRALNSNLAAQPDLPIVGSCNSSDGEEFLAVTFTFQLCIASSIAS